MQWAGSFWHGLTEWDAIPVLKAWTGFKNCVWQIIVNNNFWKMVEGSTGVVELPNVWVLTGVRWGNWERAEGCTYEGQSKEVRTMHGEVSL